MEMKKPDMINISNGNNNHVDKLIDVLIESRKAIMNADDDAFGVTESDFGDGKLVQYPLKDELLNKIDEALINVGCEYE